MGLASLFTRRPEPQVVADRSQLSFQQYLDMVQPFLPSFSLAPTPHEPIERTTAGYARRGVAGNSVVFSCAAVRLKVFSEVEFQWQRASDRKLFGTPDLEPLEQPWQGAGTGDLLARCEMDATCAGNSYWVNAGSLLRDDRVNLLRLTPHHVTIVMARVYGPGGGALGWVKDGYIYHEPDSDPVFLEVGEVAHYAPMPDPETNFRGMSWLTPVLREVEVDDQLTGYKQTIMANQATPNMAIMLKEGVTQDQAKGIVEVIRHQHGGMANAGKTLMLAGGADIKMLGANFEQLAMKATQGALETRIAAAAGVPPVVVGLSEGLQGSSLNAGNYGQARRRFADGTMRPDWRQVCGAFATLVPKQAGAKLWYSDRYVSFLQEDVQDEANIRETNTRSIRSLVDSGYHPDAAVTAVIDGDFNKLVGQHSGLFSVQLQEPGNSAKPEQMALEV